MPGIIGGLFGGSGGSSSSGTTTQQQTGSTSYPQWYTDYMTSTLGRAQDAANKPRQSYDTSKMFEPLNADQNAAFAAIRGMPGAYQPYASGAMGALNTANTRDSQAAAQPYLNEAGAAVRPWEAGNANIGASAQGWNDPRVQASYTDPYVSGAINRANDLTQRQFLEKTMPGITSQFAKGTGQLGRSNYNQFTGQAVRNLAGEMSGNADTMMDKAFFQNANLFEADQNRRQTAGVVQGELANKNMSALSNLA